MVRSNYKTCRGVLVCFALCKGSNSDVVHVLAKRYYNFNIKPDPQCEQEGVVQVIIYCPSITSQM